MQTSVSPTRLALLLGTLVALGPLAIDTYLPALLTMAGHYRVPIHDVEISVSVYVIGVALGQWLGGPLSDRQGRKPVAYVGLLVFILASLAIPFSNDVLVLYLLRFIQALGGGATVVIAGASVRDHFSGQQAARVVTGIGLVMLLAPLLAPALGSALLHLLGWQSIFFILAAYAAGLLLLVRFGLPTVALSSSKADGGLFSGYGRVLRHRQAMGFILANALAFSALFTFITDAAFLYMDYFAISASHFPLYFGANVVTMLAMNRLNVVLLRRIPSARIMQGGLVVQALASLALLILALFGKLTLALVVPLIMIAAGMVALVVPNGIGGFLSFFERDSGAATGLNGALQFMLAGLIGSLLGALHNGTPQGMIMLMALSSGSALLAYLALARGHGEQWRQAGSEQH